RALELELAKLGLKEMPPRGFDVRETPPVARAAAQASNAASRWERAQRLGTVSSAEERQQYRTEHEVAQASYRQMILEAQATLASARYRAAVLDTALDRLRETRVVAPSIALPPRCDEARGGPCEELLRQPIEYVVCARSASEGEMLRTFSPTGSMNVFKLVVDRVLKLRATVPERYYGQVKLGQSAAVTV